MDRPLRRLLTTPPPRGTETARLGKRTRTVMLILAGLGCGASPALLGYFDMSVWGLIALGLIAVAIGLLVAKPAVPTGMAAVAVMGLVAFAIWCLFSAGWAESGDRALTEGDRWILYSVFFLVLLLLIAERRDAELFLAAIVVGALAVAAYDLVRMLDGHGSTLFGDGRLLEPLGYINGMGGFYLLGFWPLAAVAERARRPIVAGSGAGLATLLACLTVLTDSRGTALAFAASGLVVMALLPGRRRRAWLLLLVLVGLAVAWSPLTDVAGSLRPHQFLPTDHVTQRAAKWAVSVAVSVGVAWGFAQWVRAALAKRWGAVSHVSTALLVLVTGGLIVLGATELGNPIHKISRQYDAFTQLKPVITSTRFTSGGGNRYDYWRIAWRQFVDHPIEGVGAGNFDRTYFLERRTNEDVRQAHSIELQALGETGAVGALLLTVFFAPIFVAMLRRGQAARRQASEIGLTLAASGMFVVWLAQTSVDWLHLIPGLTGIALGAGAILLLPARPQGKPGLRPIAPLAVAAAVILALAAVVFIGRPTLAEHVRAEGREKLASDPRAALEKASESLSLNPYSLQGYYLKAAAWARLGAYFSAHRALEEAIAREPHNYVSWALLGDLVTRRGDISAAMTAYGRALALNPRDRGLKALATNRALVERLHRKPAAAILSSGES